MLPYSLRAAWTGAPVSTPLEWSEVEPGPRSFELQSETLRNRLEKKGDLAVRLLSGSARVAPVVEQLKLAMANSP